LEGNLRSLPAEGLDHEDQVVLRDLVGKLLARAPELDRQVLILKELQDFTVEEIAEILKIKPTTVKVRLHRARKRMLEDVSEWREDN